MNAPTSGKVGASTAWDGHLTVEQTAEHCNLPCPWPCLTRGDVVELRTDSGFIAATWCTRCDQCVTRTEWLALLEVSSA